MAEKIKILFLAANPVDAGRLRLDEEIREISKKIRSGPKPDLFELVSQWAVRPSDLQDALLKHRPNIVHFSGHVSRAEGLVLEDTPGTIRPVSKQALSSLFRILRDDVRVVIFNAVYSKSQMKALAETIDYTIGINKVVGDRDAIIFAGSFYQALAYGRSIESAFNLACNQLSLTGVKEDDLPILLVRQGVERSKSFLLRTEKREAEQQAHITHIQSALARCLSRTSTENDFLTLRQAFLKGEVVLGLPQYDLSKSVETSESMIIKDSDNRAYIELDEDDYLFLRQSLFPTPLGIPPPFPAPIFIGREDAVQDVKAILGIGNQGATQKKPVVVRGWPGVGKTTLVSILARDPDIQKAYPDGVLWTALDQRPNLLSTLAQWGRALGTVEILRAPTWEEASAQMAALLRHKRMLLILDDVWEEKDALPFLQASGRNCSVLVTTRSSSLAEALSPNLESVYVLPVLTEESSLKLMSILAPAVTRQYPDECRELVRDLESLPLAIHVAASMLRDEDNLGGGITQLIEEIRISAHILSQRAPSDRAEGGMIPTVTALFKKSTDMLDDFTRECFAELGVFAPKPATFDLEAIKAVWEMDDPKPIIRKIVGYSLLEPIGGGRFQMHALLVQHALSLLAA